MLAMNVQILRHTEYKNTSTEPPQILLSDLRFYCPTSEFTVRPQNLQYDLRIYSTTSESTVRPQNLQYDLRIYSTTSEFYCPTWVFGSSNFSTTWPGGSVLLVRMLWSDKDQNVQFDQETIPPLCVNIVSPRLSQTKPTVVALCAPLLLPQYFCLRCCFSKNTDTTCEIEGKSCLKSQN